MIGDGRPLRAYWSKRERDMMFDFPRSCDGHWLNNRLGKEFMDELAKRGYDVTTMRFTIKQKTDSATPKQGEPHEG